MKSKERVLLHYCLLEPVRLGVFTFLCCLVKPGILFIATWKVEMVD